jgi:hypothetical protein
MGLVMVRPAVMAGAADGIRTVVVAVANAAPAAPPRGWLPCPPSLQGHAGTYRNVAPPCQHKDHEFSYPVGPVDGT